MEKALERETNRSSFSHRDNEGNREKVNGKKTALLIERTEINHFKP